MLFSINCDMCIFACQLLMFPLWGRLELLDDFSLPQLDLCWQVMTMEKEISEGKLENSIVDNNKECKIVQ